MADADAIIIGSGHNGLVAAFRLARAGWRVLVLERSRVIGGAIRTDEVTLPGFRHDLFATNLSLFKNSLVYRKYQSEFEQAGLQFMTCHEAFASVYDNDRAVRVSTDVHQTAAEFAKCSSADLEGWRNMLSVYRRMAPHILPFTNMALPSREAAQQALRMMLQLRAGVLELRHVVFGSARQFVDRFFSSDDAKGAFLPWAFHLDFGPDVRGGAAFAFISAATAHLNGLILAPGGAGAIVSALSKLIALHGGAFRTSTDAAEILVEDGRAVGVRTTSGDILTASRAVIANIAPSILFGRLVPSSALPTQLLRKAALFRYGPGVFMVHLALSRHLDWTAGEDLWRFNYIHLNGRADQIAATYAECCNGLLPSRPMMVVSQPTYVDPSRAPPGCAVVRLQVRATPALIAGDAAGIIHERDWATVKERFADRVIEQLEERAPGAQQAILARYVMSPEDFESENPNLIGGDCVSGSHHLDQNYLSRPFGGWTRYRTPVDRLFMVGASYWPGGGVNGTSGYLVAESLLTAGSEIVSARH
jgi:phytoene dehydrogenase-like protein